MSYSNVQAQQNVQTNNSARAKSPLPARLRRGGGKESYQSNMGSHLSFQPINDNTTQILRLVQSFFENTYNIINETEQIIELWPKKKTITSSVLNMFGYAQKNTHQETQQDIQKDTLKKNVNLVKNLYASIYIFFECLYIDEGNNIPSILSNDSINTFVNEQPFFNEYFSKNVIPTEDITSRFTIDNTNYVTFTDTYLSNIFLIVEKCKKIRDKHVPQNLINNIVLYVFTCIYSLINMFVRRYAYDNQVDKIDVTEASNYGYYPSLIKTGYRATKGENSIFTPFYKIADTAESKKSINYGERALFSRIDIILAVFLARILNGHEDAMTHIGSFRALTDPKSRIGGKRTRKNSTKNKKKRRTIKHKTINRNK